MEVVISPSTPARGNFLVAGGQSGMGSRVYHFAEGTFNTNFHLGKYMSPMVSTVNFWDLHGLGLAFMLELVYI